MCLDNHIAPDRYLDAMNATNGLYPINWQLGTVGDYLTLLAIVIAWRSLRNEQRSTQAILKTATDALELDRERWVQDRLERERWQAKLVVCKVAKRFAGDAQRSGPSIDFVVTNDSATAIFDVRSFANSAGEAQRAPGRDVHLACGVGDLSVSLESARDLHVGLDQCGVTFRDSAGMQWAKFADGHLMKLDQDEAKQTAQLAARLKAVRPPGAARGNNGGPPKCRRPDQSAGPSEIGGGGGI